MNKARHIKACAQPDASQQSKKPRTESNEFMSYPLADKYPSQTPERIRARAKEQYERNKNNPEWVEQRRAWATKWHRDNKQRKQAMDKQWRERNPIRVKQYNKQNRSNKNTPSRQCRKEIRNWLFDGINSERILRLIGCSRIMLRAHFESLFKNGMTWSNYGSAYGQWQVDHIVPLCAFDLTNLEQRYKANHYTNLQPLWKKDNETKHHSGLKPSTRIYDLIINSDGIPHRRKSIVQGLPSSGHNSDVFFYVTKNLTNNDQL